MKGPGGHRFTAARALAPLVVRGLLALLALSACGGSGTTERSPPSPATTAETSTPGTVKEDGPGYRNASPPSRMGDEDVPAGVSPVGEEAWARDGAREGRDDVMESTDGCDMHLCGGSGGSVVTTCRTARRPRTSPSSGPRAFTYEEE